jgi:hypothetical protein
MKLGTSVSAARILVVENDASIADVVACCFRCDGYEMEMRMARLNLVEKLYMRTV